MSSDAQQHDHGDHEPPRKVFAADGTPLDESASESDWQAGWVLGMIDDDGDIVWSGQPHLMKPKPKVSDTSVEPPTSD